MDSKKDVHPLKPAEIRSAEQTERIQPVVDAYTHWVLSKLVGVRGRSVNEVAYFILREWIRGNREELEHLGITVRIADGVLILGD